MCHELCTQKSVNRYIQTVHTNCCTCEHFISASTEMCMILKSLLAKVETFLSSQGIIHDTLHSILMTTIINIISTQILLCVLTPATHTLKR